jgi:hypothetical protein
MLRRWGSLVGKYGRTLIANRLAPGPVLAKCKLALRASVHRKPGSFTEMPSPMNVSEQVDDIKIQPSATFPIALAGLLLNAARN